MRLRFQKGDGLAIGLVVLLAVCTLLLFLPGKNETAVAVEIYHQGTLVKTLSLTGEESYVLTGDYTNVITVSQGAVSITSSDCPGLDCVHSGAISASGRSLVCLPNEVEVRIVGKTDDVDFVVG
jgi:hypothetical protein